MIKFLKPFEYPKLSNEKKVEIDKIVCQTPKRSSPKYFNKIEIVTSPIPILIPIKIILKKIIKDLPL